MLCKIIDTVQTKNKQKRDVALQMIMDNLKFTEEQQKSNKDQYSKGDREESEELSKILAGGAENKDELLIEFVKKIKQRADSYLKKETEKLLISQKKLNDKHRTDQIKQLMSTIEKVDN